MKKQVVVIHGGSAFDSYEDYFSYLKNYKLDFEKLKRKGWKENLTRDLGVDFEVITPKMPNSLNAKYIEWKIWFEKLIPFLEKEAVLVGHSLGGTFLAKYLSENKFPKKIPGTFLVAAPFNEDKTGRRTNYSLADFRLSKSLNLFEKQIFKLLIAIHMDRLKRPFK